MIRLALCGDVMLGRGIDQILPHPSDPALYEDYAKSATFYVQLAERLNGPIPRPVDYAYIWGDALAALHECDARIVNLETSITTSNKFELKGINYRLHPRNVDALNSASIDCCVLANNHILDWGRTGLEETLSNLDAAGIAHAGAGRNAREAVIPARLDLRGGASALVFAYALSSAGVPPSWAAANGPGVNFLPDLSERTLTNVADCARAARTGGDIMIASLHWGGNWGYAIPSAERAFAHGLIDRGGFDIVHGHSSHHPKAIEIHERRLILYGCGDFINDYEGIAGYEHYRGDLSILYSAAVSPSGAIDAVDMIPFQVRKFRLERASSSDARWLHAQLERETSRFGAHVALNPDDTLALLHSTGNRQ
jgi:poly-gamma-glutamate synthesis protein (capsule biosynthesis protein)